MRLSGSLVLIYFLILSMLLFETAASPREVGESNTVPQVAPPTEVSKLVRSGASVTAAPARGKHSSRSK